MLFVAADGWIISNFTSIELWAKTGQCRYCTDLVADELGRRVQPFVCDIIVNAQCRVYKGRNYQESVAKDAHSIL